MPTSVSAFVAAPGGTVTFTISGWASGAGSQMTISRATSGQSYSQIYSGGVLINFVDPGEQLPTGLLSGSNYLWQFIDSVGSVQVGPIQPSSTLIFEDYWLTPLFVKMLRNGIDNLSLPPGVDRAEVFHDMPINSFPPIPAITVSQVLFKQEAIGIGQDIPNPLYNQNAIWTIPAIVENNWQVTVWAKSVETREYYRDATVGIFESLIPSVFLNIGQNITHKFMAHNYIFIEEIKGFLPGFYCADLLFTMNGMFNIPIQTNYPPITGIYSVPSASGVLITGFSSGI